MKTLVAFYSFSGHTKAYAKELAQTLCADRQELRPAKPVGRLRAYTAGCFAAIKGTAWGIQPIEADLDAYDLLVICAPVWAGNAAPYVNSLLEMLPAGKEVRFKLISASGESNCRERLEDKLAQRGCKLTDLENVKILNFKR